MKSEKKVRIIGLGIIVLMLFLMLLAAASEVPEAINYQGYLTDAEGNPLNGDVGMTFRIWNAPTGGTQLWSAPHGAVKVSEGVFNVLLGSSVPITVAILDGDCFLGITVGNGSGDGSEDESYQCSVFGPGWVCGERVQWFCVEDGLGGHCGHRNEDCFFSHIV
jgi:hypothetical protein